MDRLKQGAKELGLSLSSIQIEQFETFYRELIDWNERTNLTSITDYGEMQTKHFLDSLTAVLVCDFAPGISVMDMGTGAGMPGLPLKIVYPETRLLLLDSVAKRTAFLHYLVPRLGLKGVEIVTGRAEEIAYLASYREQFAIVLSRAVAALPVVTELCLPFVQEHGVFIAYKGRGIEPEIDSSSRAIEILGGRLREVREIGLAELGERCLVVVDKIAATPAQYPRRPGLPSKRPLLQRINS